MTKKIRIFIADRNPKTTEIMRSTLSLERKIKVVGVSNNSETVIKKAIDYKPDIVLLDIGMEGLNNMSLTEILTINIPNILVVVTFKGGEKKNLKKAMTDGARDYVVKPISYNALTNTIVNLYDKETKRRNILKNKMGKDLVEKKPKIITVFSTKGGVGKSTIATNIATSIYKKTKEDVVILDLDLQFGDVCMMMNLYPKLTISDLLKEIPSLNKNILEDYLTEHPTGIKVLAAPSSPEYAEFITDSSVEKILKTLLESYKYIIIDTSPNFHNICLKALDISDYIFLVANADLPTIKNIKLGLNVMNSLDYDDTKVSLILNKYCRKSEISPSDLENAVNKKISYIIPEARGVVSKSLNSGTPLVLQNKKTSISKSINKITDFIIEKESENKKLYKSFS